METKYEAAERQLGHTSFDCALPQQWLDDIVAETGCDYDTLLCGTVWDYGPFTPFGAPHAITPEAAAILEGTS